jgi:hypothetical protein
MKEIFPGLRGAEEECGECFADTELDEPGYGKA